MSLPAKPFSKHLGGTRHSRNFSSGPVLLEKIMGASRNPLDVFNIHAGSGWYINTCTLVGCRTRMLKPMLLKMLKRMLKAYDIVKRTLCKSVFHFIVHILPSLSTYITLFGV